MIIEIQLPNWHSRFCVMRDQIVFTTLYRVVLFKLGCTDGLQNYFVVTFKLLKLFFSLTFPTFSYFVINNALLYHFLANLLAHNKKMTEKSVSCEL